MTSLISTADRITGCLLGGALGDALGWPVEFHSLAEIRHSHPEGVRPNSGFCITDDTQMTLFTAEGLKRAQASGSDPAAEVHQSYLRWLTTQGYHVAGVQPTQLQRERSLHVQRAPGLTCLSALDSGSIGSINRPLNDSKGCGGIMRIAPAAIMSKDPFQLACELAALTHGHPSGYLSAGAFAVILRQLLDGSTLTGAINDALKLLPSGSGIDGETHRAVRSALQLSTKAPTPENLELLGEGWVGEEALAIALWCVLVEPDPVKCMRLAVTHSGDSDSTGSLVGNLLGAMHGPSIFPTEWAEMLVEIRVVEQMIADLDGSPVLATA